MRADEEEPLVEVERAPGRVREAEGVAVYALKARAQGVERGARVGERGERFGERERAAGADGLGRVELDAARALDELADGDGGEGGSALARRAVNGLRLPQHAPEERGDVALDYREVLAELRDRPAVGRGAEALLLLAQPLDRASEPAARAVDLLVDFGDAVEVHKGGLLLSPGGCWKRLSTAACGERWSTCQRL